MGCLNGADVIVSNMVKQENKVENIKVPQINKFLNRIRITELSNFLKKVEFNRYTEVLNEILKIDEFDDKLKKYVEEFKPNDLEKIFVTSIFKVSIEKLSLIIPRVKLFNIVGHFLYFFIGKKCGKSGVNETRQDFLFRLIVKYANNINILRSQTIISNDDDDNEPKIYEINTNKLMILISAFLILLSYITLNIFFIANILETFHHLNEEHIKDILESPDSINNYIISGINKTNLEETIYESLHKINPCFGRNQTVGVGLGLILKDFKELFKNAPNLNAITLTKEDLNKLVNKIDYFLLPDNMCNLMLGKKIILNN